MTQNIRHFYTSGVISLCIYVGLIFFFIAGFVNKKNVDYYVMKNDTQYDQAISIDTVIEKSIPKIQEKMESIKEDEEKSSQQENANSPVLKDLFSEIPDYEGEINKNRERQKKELEKQRFLQEQQRLEKQREMLESIQKNLTSFNKTLGVMNMGIDIKAEVLPNQDNGLYDEWIAEIYKILYKNWTTTFYQDATMSVLINITNTGSFTYKILKYSPYSDYNNGVIEILDQLKEEQLPPYPVGKSISIEVNFKAKAKDE